MKAIAMDPGRRIDVDRRTVLAGLAGLVASPTLAFAAPASLWPLATQIIAGTRVADPTVLALAISALEAKFGSETVDKLVEAALARDAANVVEPFSDPQVEAAARSFIEMLYTGEITPGDAVGFHQALAWQVLSFAKAPGVCGPGFGWWTNPPSDL